MSITSSMCNSGLQRELMNSLGPPHQEELESSDSFPVSYSESELASAVTVVMAVCLVPRLLGAFVPVAAEAMADAPLARVHSWGLCTVQRAW